MRGRLRIWEVRLQQSYGCPILRVLCEGWDTQLSTCCTLGPNRHISLRFVVPTLRQKREGWATRSSVAEPNLGRSDESLLRNLCDARTWGGDSWMVRPAGLVIPASRPAWMVGRRDVLIPVHQPADPRLGFCLARTALSTPSWPGRQAVRRSLGLFLSQLHDASG
jgi:hypothetical protein